MKLPARFPTAGLGVPAGAWRWAALGFVLLALAAAGLAIAAPQVAGLAGYALLGGIGAVASLFLLAVWPRASRATCRCAARRRSRGQGQCRLGHHRRGRRGAGLQSGLSPHGRRRAKAKRRRRRNWRWRANPAPPCSIACRATLPKAAPAKKPFRWCRGSRSSPRCARLPDKQTAWWFTPRLAASTSPQPVLSRAAVQAQQPQPAALRRPWQARGARSATRYRRSVPRRADGRGLCRWRTASSPTPMRPSASSSARTSVLAGRNFGDPGGCERPGAGDALIARAAGGETG